MLRMDHQQDPLIAVALAPQGERSRCRLKETWRRTVEGERQKIGSASWNEALTVVEDRVYWRKKINGPIPHEENYGAMKMMIIIYKNLDNH